jgi:peptidoglycan/LPS O-acetylase OafA/YrhL
MKLTYRPEIDGLRAIAVVAVILYHAQITIFGYQPFKGGFIGVDIFFVISGYLITSIILKELLTTGSFSFKYFYERRVRRILPALLFVMLVSLPFAWMYLLPSSFSDFSKSILYSLGFSSNFYFHYSGQQYGAESGFLKPFLHTWSLSVEEQFYILFPIVLLVTFKFFRKYLIHILTLGFIISLGLADYGSRNHPSVSFYFIHTRMWELLAGSILAYFEIKLGHRSKNKTLNLILPLIGLILIITTIVFFKFHFPHPSFYTLPSILGTCLIIWFGNEKDFTSKLLSSKIFVTLGLVSYSLYLWHYVIFSYDYIVEFSGNDLSKKFLLIVVSLSLSLITYYFIEKPARNKNNKFNLIITIIFLFYFILIVLNIFIIQNNGFNKRLPDILKNNNVSKDTIINLLKNSELKICHNNIDMCIFNNSSNKKIHIIGDSHMASVTFDLKEKLVSKNYKYINSTFDGCLYFPGFNLIDTKNKEIDQKCNDNYFQKLKKNLIKDNDKIIIIGGRLPLYLSRREFDNYEGGVEFENWMIRNNYISNSKYQTIEDSFINEILELSKNNFIILMYPIPEVGVNPVKKIWLNRQNKTSKEFKLNYITTSYEVFKNRTKSSFELLNSIQGDNIHRVYPHKLFCGTIIKDRCVTHDDKNVFYSDDDHPSIKGAEMINDLIIKEIEKIELKSN